MPNPSPEQLDSLDALAAATPRRLPGFTGGSSIPIGDTVAERAAGVAQFDSAGRTIAPAMPNRVSGTPAPERLERREAPLAPVVPVSADYDVRFSQPVVVTPSGTIVRVPPASGLQPGERPSDPPIPTGT